MRGGRGQEVVGLVAGFLRVGESHRRDEARQEIELLEKLVVEHPATLVGVKSLVAVGRDVEGVPRDEHGSRLFIAPEAHEHVAEADQGIRRAAVLPAHRARQGVVRAMRERVTVHDEERLHVRLRSSAVTASRRHSVTLRAPVARSRKTNVTTGSLNAPMSR